MSRLSQFHNCTCQRMGCNPALCDGQFGFEEKGKRVCCKPKNGEQVAAIQMDGCVITDNGLKCDGAFIWQADHKAALLLVELKGAGDMAHAFMQLAYVKNHRAEYRDIKSALDTPQLIEKAFIVSNGTMSKPEKEKLENAHNIRVASIIHSEATKIVPDLRNYL